MNPGDDMWVPQRPDRDDLSSSGPDRLDEWAPDVEPRRARTGRRIVAAVLAALLLFGGGIALGQALHVRSGDAAISSFPGNGQTVAPNLRTVADRVSPGVVDITTYAPVFNGTNRVVPLGAGTGMVLTSSGQVLTNNHVIIGSERIRVTFPGNGQTVGATVVGADPSADVALLQLQGVAGLHTVTLGDASTLAIGQHVVAIGNALGRGGTPMITGGKVSALGRAIAVRGELGSAEHLHGLIQSDAPTSPGDSGGAIANDSGQVVGMITAASQLGPEQTTSTTGFAIPVGDAMSVINDIRAGRASSEVIIGQAGFLGVHVRAMTTQIASQLGLTTGSGVLVADTIPGTPAARAGILGNTVITAVNGTPIRSVDGLGVALHVHKPGERVQVTWVDASGTHSAVVSLITGPAV